MALKFGTIESPLRIGLLAIDPTWSNLTMIPTRLAGAFALALVFPAALRADPLPVKTVEFAGESVGRTLKYNIILPAKYEQSNERYPVLYLLHGYSGNYTHWAKWGVPEYARAYDLIVVMPDGGNSFYLNYARTEDGEKNNWEDYITKDLIQHIDSTYRTIARREGRAINGLSMGGFGGLLLGLKHPDLFCSIGSHSGAIDWARQGADRIKKNTPWAPRTLRTEPDPRVTTPGFSSQKERSPKGRMFVTVEDCARNDPFELVVKIPLEQLPHIYIDCGTEDRLLRSSQAFVKLLMDKKIPFNYAESKGEHNGPYWTREVRNSMAVQNAIIQRSLAAARKKAEEPKKAAGG